MRSSQPTYRDIGERKGDRGREEEVERERGRKGKGKKRGGEGKRERGREERGRGRWREIVLTPTSKNIVTQHDVAKSTFHKYFYPVMTFEVTC